MAVLKNCKSCGTPLPKSATSCVCGANPDKIPHAPLARRDMSVVTLDDATRVDPGYLTADESPRRLPLRLIGAGLIAVILVLAAIALTILSGSSKTSSTASGISDSFSTAGPPTAIPTAFAGVNADSATAAPPSPTLMPLDATLVVLSGSNIRAIPSASMDQIVDGDSLVSNILAATEQDSSYKITGTYTNPDHQVWYQIADRQENHGWVSASRVANIAFNEQTVPTINMDQIIKDQSAAVARLKPTEVPHTGSSSSNPRKFTMSYGLATASSNPSYFFLGCNVSIPAGAGGSKLNITDADTQTFVGERWVNGDGTCETFDLNGHTHLLVELQGFVAGRPIGKHTVVEMKLDKPGLWNVAFTQVGS